MARQLYVLIVLLGVVACEGKQTLPKQLQQYQARMARVLDVESQPNLTISLPPYPPEKVLRQPIPETKIKLFDFYNLKGCQLYSLIAQRNTSLGKLQLPSTRYIYERQLLLAIEGCISRTQEPKLREKLRKWQQTKAQQLPMVWADLIQLSDETKQAFSANFASINTGTQSGLSQTKEALSYLININQNTRPNSGELERHLQNLMKHPLPAKLWLSQLTLTRYLSYITPWLIKNTENIDCKPHKITKKAKYLTNVFQLFFIDNIQPIASQINHYQYQLSPMLNKLQNHPRLSSDLKQYIRSLNQQGFDNYQHAMQQHIQFWQAFFKRCHLKPGKIDL
ncbi:DUF3080 domain-containing protein [uncultured Paraglaciecola sp.]|uniref:DUF3080 domain-containing protein n=1 Tax=uncultured Paraglaciecola sp. TaxID=1765024 RepID=UPI002631CDD1|nr:DUF3080 domain-containing protein [uncultured Paraglaciecola sp.]